MSAAPQWVLLTGATGVVGSAVARALVATGRQVRLLSRRDASSTEKNVEFLRGDLGSRAVLEQAVRDCETVIHCAAEKNDVARMEDVNVAGTRNLLEASRAGGVRRFCHLSSVGVTGKVDTRIVDEHTPCHPMSRYEETKLRAEELVRAGLEGGQTVILRPTNVFGPTTVKALAQGGIGTWLKLALKARENAHFVYVEDVAAAVLFLTFHPDAPTLQTCIVSSDEEPGNLVGDIQSVVSTARPGAPRPLIRLPAALPYYLRRLSGARVNRGDVIYSARRLANTGFRMPYGLAAGLRAALAG